MGCDLIILILEEDPWAVVWLMRKAVPRMKGQMYEKMLFVFYYYSTLFP